MAVVRACTVALATIPGDAAIEALLSALEHSDPDTRTAAADGLGQHPAARVAAPLARLLADEPAVRDAAKTALKTLADGAVDALTEHIHHPLTRVRRDVTQLLRQLPGCGAFGQTAAG